MSAGSVHKVACADCGVMILPSTAKSNGGFCAPCGSLMEEGRAARRERQRRIATGEAFRPDAEELATVIDLHARLPPDVEWQLEPEFYADRGITNIDAALARAVGEESGAVFLRTAEGAHLELALTQHYGVLAVMVCPDETPGTYYAHTPANLQVQVPGEQQATQCCPCCGVGIRAFASRFHMPRALAIEVFRDFLQRRDAPTTRWLQIPPIFYDSRDSD